MLYEKVPQPSAPCLNCPNRSITCHDEKTCEKWAKYQAELKKWHDYKHSVSTCEEITQHVIAKYSVKEKQR